ncbi:MAG TPA: hypothetical protein VGQ57_15195, partial [Polyangiaceae bacterium]|nr:hypothetical protein [Polyangiaceae bacterium]
MVVSLAACSRPGEPAHHQPLDAPGPSAPRDVAASVAMPPAASSMTTGSAPRPTSPAAAAPERLEVPSGQRYDPEGSEKRPLVVVLHGLG